MEMEMGMEDVVGREQGEREETNWMPCWKGKLVVPLTLAVVEPGLALALDISTARHPSPCHPPPDPSSDFGSPASSPSSSSSSSSSSSGGRKPAGRLMRRRMCWTPKLHKKFVDAVNELGIGNAVPKSILKLMNVEGLTRDRVASHLQKYRHYLRVKSMAGAIRSAGDVADQPVANAPVPYGFLAHGPPAEAELSRPDGQMPYQFRPQGSPAGDELTRLDGPIPYQSLARGPIAGAELSRPDGPMPYQFLGTPAGAELSHPDGPVPYQFACGPPAAELSRSLHHHQQLQNYHGRHLVADQPVANDPVPYRFLTGGPSARDHQQLQNYDSRHAWHLGAPIVDRVVHHGFQNETVPQDRRWQWRSAPWVHQMAGQAPAPPPSTSRENQLEAAGRASRGERIMLTLFPTGED